VPTSRRFDRRPRRATIACVRQIDSQTAEDYLRRRGHLVPDDSVQIRELSGGVSNMVLLVQWNDEPMRRLVLKQARPRLRTAQPWFSSVERIWREADVLRVCASLLDAAESADVSSVAPLAVTPRILFEDRDEYLLAMTAAPEPNSVWKRELLAERLDPRVAAACGRLLGTLHAASWFDRELERQLGDRTLFDQLRVDPYYRTLARVRPDAKPLTDELIRSLGEHPCSLVHADFSPKNLLVYRDGMMMVDFETGHYGDPAFDLGFFLSHLVLKACHKIPLHVGYLELSEVFTDVYNRLMSPRIGAEELARLWSRAVRHFAGCAWARLDGKSPVDYLTDPVRRDPMRETCREVAHSNAATWPEVTAICRRRFETRVG
jgi:5-methylthioribose kinase